MTDCLDIGGASSCFTGDGVPHECAPLGPGTPENQPLADLLTARNGTGDGASGALCVLDNADASAVPGNDTLPHCDSALACTPLKVRCRGGHRYTLNTMLSHCDSQLACMPLKVHCRRSNNTCPVCASPQKIQVMQAPCWCTLSQAGGRVCDAGS